MRTTLNLDDDLVRQIKVRAAESGRTMTQVIETLLRLGLAPRHPPAKPFKLHWPKTRGRLMAGVDLNDRDALYDRMEGRS